MHSLLRLRPVARLRKAGKAAPVQDSGGTLRASLRHSPGDVLLGRGRRTLALKVVFRAAGQNQSLDSLRLSQGVTARRGR